MLDNPSNPTPASSPLIEDVPLNHRYAGFWRRFAALFIDGLILLIPNILLNHVLPIAGGILVVILYKPVFESSPILATPGKALMGMIVLSEEGARLTFKQAIVRTLVSFFSGLCLFLGYFMVFFTKRHQTLHDMVAGSIVLDQQMPQENFFYIWLNEIKNILNLRESTSASSSPYRNFSDGAGPSSFSDSTDGFQSKKMESSAVEALEKLHKLFTDGAITEAEFQQKKQELLRRI